MTTYSQLKARILRLLNDPSGRKSSDDLVYDAIIAAHDAILPWVPKTATMVLNSGSDGVSLALPDDLYQIQAIRDDYSGKILPRATLAVNTYRDDSVPVVDWLDYPNGYITLSDDGNGTEYTLYYLAYWSKPVTGDSSGSGFEIEVPSRAMQGLVYYAAASCLVPQAINSASIRQFNLKVDSGTPEDNPLKTEANYLLERFLHEMKLQPPYIKVSI